MLTGFGRMSAWSSGSPSGCPSPPPVLELDVTDAEQLAIAGRPGRASTSTGSTACVHCDRRSRRQRCLGGNFLDTPWADVATAVHVSAYSLKSLAMAALPLFGEPAASIVGLTFDATVAWPAYDWMGVAKAALESTARYLARDLGPRRIRVNLVAAGPVRTMAAKSIPGFDQFEDVWDERAPLGWDIQRRAGRPRLRGAALGLVPGHDRRDRARRRRRPRDGRLTEYPRSQRLVGGPIPVR